MGVYIKGMEMPKSCCECFAFKSNASGQLFCKAKLIAFGKEDTEWLLLKTPNWCPLVPVPPHGELIEKGYIIRGLKAARFLVTDQTGLDIMERHIQKAPTIIPAEEGET